VKHSVSTILAVLAVLLLPTTAFAEGSRDLFFAGSTGNRANIEWRNSFYGPGDNFILRRTLFYVYLEVGETLVLGSSAINVGGSPNRGDIRVFEPSAFGGRIGEETFSPMPSFSCVAYGAANGDPNLGRIASRSQELAGPNTTDNDVPDGFDPCLYQAPVQGLYGVVFWGPSGDNRDSQTVPSGLIDPDPRDFGPGQDTSVTAWDVTVRADPAAVAAEEGRLFTYSAAMIANNNGQKIQGEVYIPTADGFVYRVFLSADPFGFVVYSNRFGYEDSNGEPLYHNVLADPTLTRFQQNQLVGLQGDVRLDLPEYPIFFNSPPDEVRTALDLPLVPTIPRIRDLRFVSSSDTITTTTGVGGEIRFNMSGPGVYSLVLSSDGVNFDRTSEENRTFIGFAEAAGAYTIKWDGTDNEGEVLGPGRYLIHGVMQGGEMHLPQIDVENNLDGGPRIELTNPPGGECPPFTGGCFAAFYDDRGYETADGVLVGTEVNGPLCAQPNNGRVPDPIASDPILGYDSRTDDRAWGFTTGGNPPSVCDPRGGFGDKKGIDYWVFYPSEEIEAPLFIVEPLAIELRSFTAQRGTAGAQLHWETGIELDSAGFRLYRGSSEERNAAVQISKSLIPARGSAQAGARYTYLDSTVPASGPAYYWLREVALDGSITEYGPFTLSGAAPTQQQQVWLPIVRW
jgi:hypothetical protein